MRIIIKRVLLGWIVKSETWKYKEKTGKNSEVTKEFDLGREMRQV